MDNTESNYNLYDKVLDNTARVLFKICREPMLIAFENFEPKDKAHLALYRFAQTLSNSTFGWPVAVKLNFGKFWVFLLKNRKHGVVKRLKGNGIDVADLITKIETESNAPGAFEAIYDAYYKE